MSAIRPLEPEDIAAVARLYERVMRPGTRGATPALETFFRETLLDQPWADEDVPSLVYEDPDGGLVGFLGSHVRRFRLDGRSVRVGCSGQLVADPDAARPGIGALLMRAYMHGAQDVSSTDGATPLVRSMWERLGGITLPATSIGWTRVMRPARFAAAVSARRGWLAPRRSAAVLDALVAPLTQQALRPTRPDGSAEPLDSAAALGLMERGRWRLRPDYDEAYLEWVFAQMAAVRERGELRRLVVRDERDQPLGWAVYYLAPRGISEVQQIAAFGDPGPVIDHVVWDAFEGGSTAVQGRLEPPLVAAVTARRCLLRRTAWALTHSDDADLLAAMSAGNSLVTRMDGEWWMGPHLIP